MISFESKRWNYCQTRLPTRFMYLHFHYYFTNSFLYIYLCFGKEIDGHTCFIFIVHLLEKLVVFVIYHLYQYWFSEWHTYYTQIKLKYEILMKSHRQLGNSLIISYNYYNTYAKIQFFCHKTNINCYHNLYIPLQKSPLFISTRAKWRTAKRQPLELTRRGLNRE